MQNNKLTIGMATCGNLDNIFWTVQSLRLYHDLTNIQILIIDNKGNMAIRDWINNWGHGKIKYIEWTDIPGTSQARNKVFEFADGDYVLCIDDHVLLKPGSLNNLCEYMNQGDLIQGPMIYDSINDYTTHMEPIWRDNMFGVWAESIPEDKLPLELFEIPMHGLGCFGCKKDLWLKFNENFRGFGGEEGYIHEKFRKNGRKVICLPWLKWSHKFVNNNSVSYQLNIRDRIKNYLIGFSELNMDLNPIYNHFGKEIVERIIKDEKIKIKKIKNNSELFSYIYSHATNKGLYGTSHNRNGFFINYIKENVSKNSSILDLSCGRGFIIRWANSAGYKAEGTEIADWLFSPGGDLYGLPIKKLSYEELNTINSNSYDVVISNDVLEHLDNDQIVENAIQQIVRISKKNILISTGGMFASKNPFSNIEPKNLHNIIKPEEWWINLCKKYFNVLKVFKASTSLFIFGTKFNNKKILFPEYPLKTKIGSLNKNITVESLKNFPDIIIGNEKQDNCWCLAWGYKKNNDAVLETGFFWDAMHIDKKGLYKESSLNDSWDIIETFKAPKDGSELILNSKHTSKYSQTNNNITWNEIVLAVQNPTDRSVLSCGTEDDYWLFIEKTCKHYGKNLFIKLHPWNNGDIEKKYKEIADIYKCKIAKCDHSVIKKCKFVIVYNSTFCIDCFVRGVPVMFGAPGYFSNLPVGFDIEANYKLINFLVWKYCFNMNMPIEKWIKMLKLYAFSEELFPLTEEFCYGLNCNI